MSSYKNEPIAIIGSSCRFAGDATTPSKLWELLRKPRDVLSKIPDNRFSADGFHHPDGTYHGHSNVKDSYILEQDPAVFDAQFFGIKPIEARAMDPQHRLLLEASYEALETAGIPHESLRGSNTAVYAGQFTNDYHSMVSRDLDTLPTYTSVGTFRTMLANRVSYFFDWHGPSISIDTACSGSLYAVHLATQALRAGDTKVALACGSNLLLGPDVHISESKLRMLSENGQSRMWDASANGYARGDGVAVVVLKTLSAALADGDHIECLVRETGINQNGATKGIAMPSVESQLSLIRETYAKAGLDPRKASDRCQFFEAHGTGTPAGDPVEAEAIRDAFFGKESGQNDSSNSVPMYVGSIKTLVGHTEATAGLAGVIKASLALQNKKIPPNMLFNQLSPRVAPFYKNLEVATTLRDWPTLPDGVPRRVSVNSFGLGGANAHAILENYERPSSPPSEPDNVQALAPLMLSANSDRSIIATLRAYSKYLEQNPSCNIRDLGWTLRKGRSAMKFRETFPAMSTVALKGKIEMRLKELEGESSNGSMASSLESKPARILGVFTGQGAQYARMGAELIEKSTFAKQTIKKLEGYLDELPASDRPSWSLEEEILADATSTRLDESVISHPLCTAIQILLVDMTRLAGIHLHGVVGHSGGEVGAAYAAGYIEARHALYISYYRGIHSRKAVSPNGGAHKGTMMAVGTSMEDASMLCSSPEFAGRVSVACCNSSSSVTLAGDEDAISELEALLGEEKRFRRRLKVDKAYHSQHMLPCYQPFITSLRSCDIKVGTPSADCTLYSSVYESITDVSVLTDVYWADNMLRPVLFSQALEKALSKDKFDLALEIGPHPALKGPASQTIQDVMGSMIPYYGILSRGMDAVEASSLALGNLWSKLGNVGVDLDNYDEKMSGSTDFTLLKDIPTYQWDHETNYWYESQMGRRIRQRKDKVHTLLGHVSPDSSSSSRRWRQILRTNECSWLEGHQLQGSNVFPAAGIIATALEASRSLAKEDSVELIELLDFQIHQALLFNDDDGIEVFITLTETPGDDLKVKRANFTYSAFLGKESESPVTVANARVAVFMGKPSPAVLSEREPTDSKMVSVDSNSFYSSLETLGYGFSGPYRGLESLTRMLGKASGIIQTESTDSESIPLLVHPTVMDCALQSVLLAHSHPHDGQLWSLHVPTSIQRIRVNPAICGVDMSASRSVAVDSQTFGSKDRAITGDVSLFEDGTLNAAVQFEDVRLVPLSGATAADDKNIFSRMVWSAAETDADALAHDHVVTQEQIDLSKVLDRIASYYLRKFHRDLPSDHAARSQHPFKHYLNYARHVDELHRSGENEIWDSKWLDDTLEDIMAVSSSYENLPDVKIMHAIGREMPRVFRGETTILEHLLVDHLLDDYYVHAYGFPQVQKWCAGVVSQITNRYPDMNILELGAGTGGATKSILKSIGKDFSSYTFTDISTGFFGTAEEVFSDYSSRMVFKALDIERDPVKQGYQTNHYDLVVASFVLHATTKLEETMHHVRKLLKPGGYVVLGELTDNKQTSIDFIFGCFPGWWAGVDEGRILSPAASVAGWDAVLRRTGFSGIDAVTPDRLKDIYPGLTLVAQAIDDRVSILREPMSIATSPLFSQDTKHFDDLIVIGGSTTATAQLATGVVELLQSSAQAVYQFPTLASVDLARLTDKATVLCLTELDGSVFKSLSAADFASVKAILTNAKSTSWFTKGKRSIDPFANMITGFSRTARSEMPGLRLQVVDVEGEEMVKSRVVAEMLLRQQLGLLWTNEKGYKLLWSIEPEIVMSSNGQQMVPRLKQVTAANQRYNSTRRAITHPVDISKSTVSVQRHEGVYSITDATIPRLAAEQATVSFKSRLTTLKALRTPIGHCFMTFGVNEATKETYLALTESVISSQEVHSDKLHSVQVLPQSEAAFMALLAWNIICKPVIDMMLPGQVILVHNASLGVSEIVSRRAALKGATAIFSTDSLHSALPASWLKLSRTMSRRALQDALPKSLSCFMDLSLIGRGASTQGLLDLDCLPTHCRVENAASMVSDEACMVMDSQETLHSFLNDVVKSAQEELLRPEAGENQTLRTVTPSEVAAGIKLEDQLTVIHWESSEPILSHVRRLDSQPLFKHDKTYWLVGLSDSLVKSLGDWMLGHGAKAIAISSRESQMDPDWIEAQQSKGNDVKFFSCDVTDESALKRVHKTIRTNMPTLGGVAQDTMVPTDTTIRDMSYEQMNDILQSEVNGRINLDKLFSDDNLDFFLFLSSMGGLIGSTGQASRNAANSFLSTLAAQRRQRGLVASVINVGAILGVDGDLSEASNANHASLHEEGLMGMSEGDFHQIFAEGIEACRRDRLDSDSTDVELSTGLCEIQKDSKDPPLWTANPIFARFFVQNSEMGSSGKKSAGSSTSIKVQLETAATRQEVLTAVENAVTAKLGAVLQMDTTSSELMGKRTHEIGLDSLIAVDLRSWFMNNLAVDVAVLTLLSGVAIADLVKQVLQEMPAELIPNVGEAGQSGGKDGHPSTIPEEPDSTVSSGNPKEQSVVPHKTLRHHKSKSRTGFIPNHGRNRGSITVTVTVDVVDYKN